MQKKPHNGYKWLYLKKIKKNGSSRARHIPTTWVTPAWARPELETRIGPSTTRLIRGVPGTWARPAHLPPITIDEEEKKKKRFHRISYYILGVIYLMESGAEKNPKKLQKLLFTTFRILYCVCFQEKVNYGKQQKTSLAIVLSFHGFPFPCENCWERREKIIF